MNFKEYTELAKQTILFDSNEKLMFCTTTGLMGEWTEFIEHLLVASDRNLIQKEIGDVFWYLAILTDYLGINMSDELPTGSDTDVVVGFIVVGKIQELLKKVVRDNNWKLQSNETKLKLQDLFYTLYALLLVTCKNEEFNLSDVLSGNIDKLFSRQKRGVLGGSGDER